MYITRFEFFMDARGYTLEWAEFLRMHAVISIALHAVSLYLVVFMAFIRLMALDVGQSKWMMPKRAR
uniref:Uncharacterized protein n=1 Tax=Ditylenchus dipsaci TaxID=166011 RepID=A0A915CUJ0_9BILA